MDLESLILEINLTTGAKDIEITWSPGTYPWMIKAYFVPSYGSIKECGGRGATAEAALEDFLERYHRKINL